MGSYTADNLVVAAGASPEDLDAIADKLRHGEALDRYGPFDLRRRGNLIKWIHQDTQCTLLRPLRGVERARALGYPPESTYPELQPAPFTEEDYRVGAIAGNGFPLNVVRDLLRPLAADFQAGRCPAVRTTVLPAATIDDAEACLDSSGGRSRQ